MFKANTDAIVQVTSTASGVGFVPSSVQMRVEGPAGIIQDWATLVGISDTADPGVPSLAAIITNDATGLTVKIAAAFNSLTTGVKEGRLVSLRMGSTDLTTSVVQTVEYLVTDESVEAEGLAIGSNSFQTYPQAIVTADMMTDLKGWPAAEYAERVRAMQHAYYFLSRMSYELLYDRDDVYFRNRASWGLPYVNTVGNLSLYNEAQFLGLDPQFRNALSMAQVAEADERLAVDPLQTLRDNGVTQNVVGDTSASFRATPPLRLSVSRRALEYLHGYVKFAPRLIRS